MTDSIFAQQRYQELIFERTFTLSYKSTGIVITGVNDRDLLTAVLPTEYHGQRLVGIADRAFSYLTKLTRLVLPADLVFIGERAFSGCTTLTEVSLPSTVIDVGVSAFSGMTALRRVESQSAWDNIPTKCFFGCNLLQELITAVPITAVGESAFSGCTALSQLTLSDDVKVAKNAFCGSGIKVK